ncbi:hypothetical protein [Actinomadura keratinilytica]|uniref:hypothetical protein n=1 Tax=Actinomadura keratinilytica TaxID=547461 RepID=UPI0036124AD3
MDLVAHRQQPALGAAARPRALVGGVAAVAEHRLVPGAFRAAQLGAQRAGPHAVAGRHGAPDRGAQLGDALLQRVGGERVG